MARAGAIWQHMAPFREVRGVKGILANIVAGVFVAVTVTGPLSARAQEMPASPPAPREAVFGAEELDQLVAPIALYPDSLLGQILMASTYPLEVVQAARWVRVPANAALKGDALSAALANLDWDPSVKSLVPFPQVLEMMDTYLDWTQKLGDAFLAQEAGVMNAVQRLRRRALAAGNLKSTAQQSVVTEGQAIVIRPANPDLVYVPVYEPSIIYGVWPYPLYPPYYFPPPSTYYVVPSVVAGFYFFSVGIIVVRWLWAWDRCDWHHRRIYVDVHRFNVINVHRPPITRNVWIHNRYHRRGVPYPSRAVNERFGRGYPPAAERRREYRGYDHGELAGRPAAPPRVSATPHGQVAHETPPRTRQPLTPPPAQAPRQAPPTPAPAPAPPERPRVVVPRTSPPTQVPRQAPPITVEPRAGPSAFQGYSSGTEVRRDAERGRASRQGMSSGRVAPPAHTAPSRGGQTPESRGQPYGQPGRQPSAGGVRR
jgi:Protein of unknown function (DUF3300)